MSIGSHLKQWGCASLAVGALVAGLVALPQGAAADTIDELQANVERSSSDLDAAQQRIAELQSQIEANRSKVDELNAQLPEQEERAQESMRVLYKMSSNSQGLLELILSSENFNEFLSTMQYLGIIQTHNTEELNALINLKQSLLTYESELSSQMAQAQDAQTQAQDALNNAVSARKQFEEEARRQQEAEAAAAAAALAEAQKQVEEGNSTLETQNGISTIEVPSTPAAAQSTPAATPPESSSSSESTTNSSSSSSSTGPFDADGGINFGPNEESFVSTWAPRINAFLSGSPLSGKGETFARAAWQYGIDPRLSPAISAVESSKGAVCFLPYNAWGWGRSSWSSWDEAIYAHISGIARVYKTTYLTVAMARKYNPPNSSGWYASVLAYINRI